jgi:hypothetical protein
MQSRIMNSKICRNNWPWPISRWYPGMRLKGMRKPTEIIILDNRSPDRFKSELLRSVEVRHVTAWAILVGVLSGGRVSITCGMKKLLVLCLWREVKDNSDYNGRVRRPAWVGGHSDRTLLRPRCCAASLSSTVNHLYAVHKSCRGLLQGSEPYSLSVRCMFRIPLLILRLFNDVFQLCMLSVVPRFFRPMHLVSINSSPVPP